MAVVAEAADGGEVPALVERHAPDVVVLDVSMPGSTGLAVAAVLRQRHPDTRILILSMYADTEYVLQAVRAGANGYLLKDGAATELPQAVRAAMRGESFFSPAIAARLSAALRGEGAAEPARGPLDDLTAREREVLRLLALGHTNQEIAERLIVSVRTVETHRANLQAKLGVERRADLLRHARGRGLVAP